ncbi:ABC transporter permease subunit [Trueperella pyogenes]|uniref:ABC transporter permease subunit n=1 Tax=Trueperella pyogenes TaxID=1661 RepID=UPI0032470159
MKQLALYRHEVSTRFFASLMTVLSIFAMVLLMLVVMQSVDLSFVDSYPETFRQMTGVPVGASPEILAYGSTLTLMGGLALAGFAVVMGADIVAGEEARQTLSTILSYPFSRRTVVATKAVTLLTIIGASVLLLWASTEVANLALSIEPGQAHILELCLVIGANALFHGSLAFLVGSITADRGLATGVSGIVLTIGWLASSVLPSVPNWADHVKVFPYGWFTEPNPLMNGLDGSYLALQLGFSLLFSLIGIEVFIGRDVRLIPAQSLKDRLSSLASLTAWRRKLHGRRLFRGAGKQTTLFGLIFSSKSSMVWIISLVMASFTILMGSIWDQVEHDLDQMVAAIPEELMVIFGAEDMSTPAGFMWGEMFGMMAPAAVIVIAAVAANILANEESSGRLGVILAHPVSRTRALTASAETLVSYLAIVCVIQALATWGAALASTMELEVVNIWGTCLHLFALGVCIGGITLLVVAATGSTSASTWTAVLLGLIGHFGHTALSLVPDTEQWAKLSPFHWYSYAKPLENGVDLPAVVLLLAVGIAAILLAYPFFQRRDLKV